MEVPVMQRQQKLAVHLGELGVAEASLQYSVLDQRQASRDQDSARHQSTNAVELHGPEERVEWAQVSQGLWLAGEHWPHDQSASGSLASPAVKPLKLWSP